MQWTTDLRRNSDQPSDIDNQLVMKLRPTKKITKQSRKSYLQWKGYIFISIIVSTGENYNSLILSKSSAIVEGLEEQPIEFSKEKVKLVEIALQSSTVPFVDEEWPSLTLK
ncbi:uncharacterized protein ASCRUDRAFT_73001 [Ascoidea rubescens DSM 1968]|uniref:Uncharacterized protein n=1 Tax=Ascoidea rubescens DSM 1968 TaxID=1344418 RepID=A0A1D2V924_9ASCO|nr:hypothetical protein ASCRUDRAFT_73001 [Ascoidea rubescens DSM 1968]ODV58005.1 hypothetical protein ASCRUDRAFT_73001 [Ascoidea rubescens DSM 1968]